MCFSTSVEFIRTQIPDEENQQQNKITKYMKQEDQTQLGEPTTTTIGSKQQQHQTTRKPIKLMVKSRGIETTDMKEFLESKKTECAARLGEEQSKTNLAQLHTA